ncbi:MAG: Ig-like domain-containing protein, partial [Anaerolineae bacterium]|nr:Ig-like domain-containing protein [Anaerolineae bacterium]
TDTPPQVTTTTPINTATVGANQAVTLNFTETVNIAAGAFTFTCNATPITGGFNTSVVLPASAVTTITLTPVNPLPFGANCVVTAISSLVVDSDPVDPPNFLDGDNSGDLIDDVDNFVLNFTVDAQATENTTQVEIANVPSPIAGAVNVDLDTNIVVTFSEAVNVNLTSFALDCGGAIAFTVSGSGTATITVDPTPATLPINTLCSFDIIAANITDVDTFDPPDLLDADVNYTFTTVNDNPPSVDFAEAEVGGVFTALPLGVGQFADPDTDLRITFDEAVTVTGNWAQLDCTTSGIQDVTSGLGVTDADPVFTLNPATDLTPGEACQLTIFGANISDDDAIDPPDTMLADAVFTFTVQDTAPRVITVTSTPASASINPNNQTVTLNFTENVDIAAGGITWTCGSAVTFTPALPQNNVNTITLTPTTTLPSGTCTVFLESTLITDTDTVDGPDELDGDFNFDINNGDADDYSFIFFIDAPPQVSNATVEVGGVPTFLPLGGAQRADVDTNIVVNFNENIDATVAGVTLECDSVPVPFAGLPVTNNTSITVNPTSDLPGGATCTITMVFTEISDTDTFDPPNLFDGNFDLIEGPSLAFVFITQQMANDDAYTVTPHLTYTSPTGVRAND